MPVPLLLFWKQITCFSLFVCFTGSQTERDSAPARVSLVLNLDDLDDEFWIFWSDDI